MRRGKTGYPIFRFYMRGERERRKELQLLSPIYGDRVVGIRRAKNEISSIRLGLHVGIENTRFL